MTAHGPRFAPEKIKVFQDHQIAWRDGRINLVDFVLPKDRDANGRPLWYPKFIQAKIDATFGLDKAAIFEAIGYRPGIPQCRFHASRMRFKVFSGGARGGKSIAGGHEFVPLLLTPGMNLWIVAPEYEQGDKEFSYIRAATVDHPVIGKAFGQYVERVAHRPSGGDMEIRFDFGPLGKSFLKVKSCKREDSLLSEELDGVMVVEAATVPESAWKRRLKMRLATRHGMAIFPSSPSGMGWVAGLYNRGMSGEEEHFAVNCDSRMNPTQDMDEIRILASDLSDEDWNEQIEGRPVPRHGLVYKDFDPRVHVDTWQKEWPRPSWRKGRAIDFGHTDPAVVLWIAQDEDGRFYVYREWYQRRRLVSDMVREIAAREGYDVEMNRQNKAVLRGRAKLEEVTGHTITDWDAAGRAELHYAGVHVRKADKDIGEGIGSVSRNLRVKDDGRPRLYVHPECRELIREFGSYAWAGDKDEPAKNQDDHAMDALRYYIHSLDPRGIALQSVTA